MTIRCCLSLSDASESIHPTLDNGGTMSHPDPAETRATKRRRRQRRRRRRRCDDDDDDGDDDGDGDGGDDGAGTGMSHAQIAQQQGRQPQQQQQQQQQVEGVLESRGVEGDGSSASSSASSSSSSHAAAAAQRALSAPVAAAAAATAAAAAAAAAADGDADSADPLDGDSADPLVLPFDADQGSGEIAHDGELVWSPRMRVRRIRRAAREGLRREASLLVTITAATRKRRSGGCGDKVRISKGALVKLVKNAKGSTKWAKYVARLSNLQRPEVENVAGQPEMLFQQLVFSPIAGLFYCFNNRTYKADDVASSGICCSALSLQRKRSASAVSHDGPPASRPANVAFACRPDAAILATRGTSCWPPWR
jgi:hypothetical protein